MVKALLLKIWSFLGNQYVLFTRQPLSVFLDL